VDPVDVIGWFEDIGLRDRAAVGGKGGSLGELTRAGIPVPPTSGRSERPMSANQPMGCTRSIA